MREGSSKSFGSVVNHIPWSHKCGDQRVCGFVYAEKNRLRKAAFVKQDVFMAWSGPVSGSDH